MSIFYALLHGRYRVALGPDEVPEHLEDKLVGAEFARSRGWRVPESKRFDSAAEAISATTSKKFALKASGFFGGKHIYLLQQLESGKFLDLNTLQIRTTDELSRISVRTDYWLVEDLVESTVAGHVIPMDYKFYCFGGQIALILQIDRSSKPARGYYFDGSFMPLVGGTDFSFDTEYFQMGAPVVPLHASAMVKMARDLSQASGARFLSVDCYDSPDGPVFGEFTLRPGAPYSRTATFSRAVIRELDQAARGQQIQKMSGFDIDYDSFWAAADKDQTPLTRQHPAVVGAIQARAALGMRDYRFRTEVAAKNEMKEHYQACLTVASAMLGPVSSAYELQKSIQCGRGFFKGRSREMEFVSMAEVAIGQSQIEQHRLLMAEMRASRGDQDAFKALRLMAEGGNPRAGDVVQRLVESFGSNDSLRNGTISAH
ncbi:ATP-grasp fold amidoligase family protein [Jannaschia rubra]|uniref:ATP-grasp domain-containing protein n=1 Tax=Jannaschia rubra TaxID=282197 RepID=A0A0M6XSE0_9RHOB|nr:ATP-grasp fold amidoligase family protein [Jannaschia rubra]CTQ33095.1 hypothetical protein JAN5088_01875 [Jannaschia rubra]SFG74168.1 TupA-like ATPgrasp [Jannaschia rubra]